MNKEIETLTGLRGLAALVVMLYHFLERDVYFQSYVPSLIKRGYLGVDVFFVLSGFVMALSYARFFKNGIAISDYKTFMVKRFARVYPLYLFITLVFLVKYELNLSGVWVGDFHANDFIACVLMVQAWGFGFSGVAGATWSLSTEFFAYIIFPVVVFFAVFARAAYAWGVFAMASAFLYVVASSRFGIIGPLDVVASSSILPLLRCLAGFCLGLIGYRLSHTAACRKILSSSAVLVVLLVGLLVTAHFEAHDLVLFAFFPLIVVMLFYQSAFARLMFAGRTAYHLGVVSYSLYLVHPLFVPVKARLEPIAERHIGNIAHPLTLVAVSLLSLVFACVLYRFIEVPGRLYVQRRFLRNPVQPGRLA